MNTGVPERRPVVLHSSWRGRFTALLGPLFLLGLGSYGIAFGGLQVLNGVIAAVGALLLLVALLDFPLWAVFTADGIDRRCVLRSEHLGWERVRAIARPGARGPLGRKRASSSGLVAEVGRRPYLLVDRLESRPEHEAIERALNTWVPGLAFRASTPAEGTPPTWLHKRRRGAAAGGLVDELELEDG